MEILFYLFTGVPLNLNQLESLLMSTVPKLKVTYYLHQVVTFKLISNFQFAMGLELSKKYTFFDAKYKTKSKIKIEFT